MIRPRWRLKDTVLDPNAGTVIMGVLNVTPDSFSDGGRFLELDAAVAQGVRLRDEGAHLVDVGGESTRPGAEPVDEVEEMGRVIPIIESLAAEGVAVSVDTSKSAVAERAIDAGAVVVNDVNGLRAPGMIEVCAAGNVGVVAMHMQGNPRTMQVDPRYEDVVGDVRRFLGRRIEEIVEGGVDFGRVAIDPGIGFGKTTEHNLSLLRGIPHLAEVGAPVVIGTSRKGFLGKLTGRAADQRDVATAATVAIAIGLGASVVRVHDVASAGDAAAVADAMVSPGSEADGNRTQAT